MPRGTYLGVGKQVRYGIHHGKVMTLYYHRYEEEEDLEDPRIVYYWRTSKRPNGGVTFHGKIYKTRENAEVKNINHNIRPRMGKRKKKTRRRNRSRSSSRKRK